MNDTIKEYNKYLEQIEMILHPNLFNAFMKIHNKILEEEVSKAKAFKPSQEWVELKNNIDKMNEGEPFLKPLLLKSIIKKIKDLPIDKSW